MYSVIKHCKHFFKYSGLFKLIQKGVETFDGRNVF